MDISVIIPTYNRSTLIGETVESILAQTLQPAEVVVIDDGSTDNTEAVVRSFSGVKYHRISNSGVCAARNAGVALSTCPWLAFCDSDDLWEPDKLRQHTLLAEAAPDVEYQFTNFVLFGDSDCVRSKFDTLPDGFWNGCQSVGSGMLVSEKPFYSRVIRRQPVFQSTLLMSRRFFDVVGGFNESLGRMKSEDLEFTLRCAERAPTGVLTAPLARIRKHAQSFSSDQLRLKLGETAILQYALAHHAAATACSDLILDEIAERSRIAAELAFERGEFNVVRQVLGNLARERLRPKTRLKYTLARMPAPLAQASRTFAMLLRRNRRRNSNGN